MTFCCLQGTQDIPLLFSPWSLLHFLFFLRYFKKKKSFDNTQLEILVWRNIDVWKKKRMLVGFWKTWPRPGMSISFPAASQHQDVFNAINETCRRLLVIRHSSPRLHLEKILIVSFHIVKPWKANLMILAISDAEWIATEENSKSDTVTLALVSVSLEGILTIGSIGRQRQIGRQCSKSSATEESVWSLIQDRVEDLRFSNASQGIHLRRKPLRASQQMFISSSSLQPSTTAQTCCRDSQKSAKWQKGSSNQGAARPMYSCSGLLLHPRCRRRSVSLVSHSLSFFYLMVTVFKLLSCGKSSMRQMPICEADLFLEC